MEFLTYFSFVFVFSSLVILKMLETEVINGDVLGFVDWTDIWNILI